MNTATFVGYKHGGIAGSVLTTVGMVLPSFVIIYLISGVLDHFLEIPLVANAFRGIQAGVALLIAAMNADGKSIIQNVEQIDRGYQNIEGRLNALGAKIVRKE